MNDHNEPRNIYISSKNLLTFIHRCNNHYTNLLSWNKDGRGRVNMILILFLKLQKKKVSKREKRAKVLASKNFSKSVSFFERFLTFCQIGKIFLNFFCHTFLLAQQEWRFSNSFQLTFIFWDHLDFHFVKSFL